MDAVYEENEQVYGHPKDPYVRIDALQSSRHIKIVLQGETVAESRQPVIVYETGLSPRYFFQQDEVNHALLRESGESRYNPYLGEARFYAWSKADAQLPVFACSYPDPLPEAAALKNRIGIYHELADEVFIDGQRWQPREGESFQRKVI
jgi:uncharacterized protein (DUF427 family)